MTPAPFARLSPVRRSRPTRRVAGFTLIELMVTVAIVGILTAIAYPSYRTYVLRGQIVSATNALSAMSANMERYFQDNRQYTSLVAGTAPMSPCDSVQLASMNPVGTFTMTCPAATYSATTFVITATGTTGGATAGFSYSIDQAGNQSSTVTTLAPSAWRITCSATWETRAGSC